MEFCKTVGGGFTHCFVLPDGSTRAVVGDVLKGVVRQCLWLLQKLIDEKNTQNAEPD